MKVLASNKKAYFNFEILESIQAGIVLHGWEVKSLKGGRGNITGAYVKEQNNELSLLNCNIPEYKFSSLKILKEESERSRKLLLHKKQIILFKMNLKQKGTTLIPLEIIQDDNGLIKIVVSLVKGQKKYDKRAKLKEKDLEKRIYQDRKKYNI